MRPKNTKTKKKVTEPKVIGEELSEQIKTKAYELFERKGCCHGGDCDDWYEAEGIVTQSST